MQILNEKIDFENQLLSLNVFQSRRMERSGTPDHWHYHKETEILAIHSGKLDVHVENEVYRLSAGDVIVIGPSQLHRDRNLEPLHYTVLQFGLEHYFEQSTLPYLRLFSDDSTPLSRLNYIFRDRATRDEVYNCVTQIYDESRRKENGYEIAVNVLIKRILLILLRSDRLGLLAAAERPDEQRLKPVLDYIEANIEERISVEEAAELAGMSYYYFVKFFHRTMGMSFTEFVNYKKIKTAERILLTKKMTIARVGESIGMPNMAHFYKVFRRYNHCSPNEYRKKMMRWTPEG